MNKTEQIRDLKKEFITWYKLKVADFEWIGEEDISDWWLSKLSEQRQAILEEVENYIKENRHKIERPDRYVLDTVISIFKNETKEM